jgi:hypothetical protein
MTRKYFYRKHTIVSLTLCRPELMGQTHPVSNKMEAHNVWMVC